VGLIITFFSLMSIAWWRPYISHRDNLLAVFQQCNQFLVLCVVMLIVTQDSAGLDDVTLSYALIVLYTATGISMMIAGSIQIMKEVKDDDNEFHITDFLQENMNSNVGRHSEMSSNNESERGVSFGPGDGGVEMTENPMGEGARGSGAGGAGGGKKFVYEGGGGDEGQVTRGQRTDTAGNEKAAI
jgi:hypothetical protein